MDEKKFDEAMKVVETRVDLLSHLLQGELLPCKEITELSSLNEFIETISGMSADEEMPLEVRVTILPKEQDNISFLVQTQIPPAELEAQREKFDLELNW